MQHCNRAVRQQNNNTVMKKNSKCRIAKTTHTKGQKQNAKHNPWLQTQYKQNSTTTKMTRHNSAVCCSDQPYHIQACHHLTMSQEQETIKLSHNTKTTMINLTEILQKMPRFKKAPMQCMQITDTKCQKR